MQKIGLKFPKLAEIPRFLCRVQDIAHLPICMSWRILGIGFQPFAYEANITRIRNCL